MKQDNSIKDLLTTVLEKLSENDTVQIKHLSRVRLAKTRKNKNNASSSFSED